jgi:hypothetical protein
MHDVLFVLTRQSRQGSKLAPVDTRLAIYETRLVYLQKKNLPRQHVAEASTYSTVHCRKNIHALSRCMDSVQPRTLSVWMECILASYIRHVGCTRIKHVATTQLITRREDGIRGMDHSIIPRNSRDAVQHTYNTRGSSSLVCKKVSLTETKCVGS